MAFTINEKLLSLTPYTPSTAEYAVRLDANESFIPLPDYIREKIARKISRLDFMRYPDPLANGVCSAFAQYHNISGEWVTAGNGSDELIAVIINAFTQRGDGVAVIDPDFSMYKFYAELSECRVISVEKNDKLQINVQSVIDTVNRENARVLVFSNPCNPTSLGISREEVRKIVNAVNALVVLDEAYMDFWDQSLISEVSEYDNLIILRTCSKMMGMAAARMGFAVAGERITRLIRAAKSPYNVNRLSEAAAETVLLEKAFLKESISRIIASRESLYEGLYKIFSEDVFFPCANFVFIKLQNAADLYECLKKNGILVRFFPGYLRITAGSPEENEKVLKALEKYGKTVV